METWQETLILRKIWTQELQNKSIPVSFLKTSTESIESNHFSSKTAAFQKTDNMGSVKTWTENSVSPKPQGLETGKNIIRGGACGTNLFCIDGVGALLYTLQALANDRQHLHTRTQQVRLVLEHNPEFYTDTVSKREICGGQVRNSLSRHRHWRFNRALQNWLQVL